MAIASVDRLNDDERERICELYFDQGKPMSEIAGIMGRSVQSVSKTVNTYRPNVKLASRLLKASAHTLVERVVAKADVDQAIDILSRPNIGVLEPMPKAGAVQGGTGIYISVAADSCGAVNVGVRQELNNEARNELRLPGMQEGQVQAQLPEPDRAQGDDVGAQFAAEQPAEAGPRTEVVPKRRNRPRHVISKEGKRNAVILPYPIATEKQDA